MMAEDNINQFLISIVIPVYNGKDYLAERLEHLLSHNFEYVQIIVVNDGSTDRSLDICKRHLDDKPNTKIITQENYGLSVARNVGIENASGEYIVFLDSDDILLHKGFAEMIVCLAITSRMFCWVNMS